MRRYEFEGILQIVGLVVGILILLFGVYLITRQHTDLVSAGYDVVGGAVCAATGGAISLVSIGGEDTAHDLLDFFRELFRLH